MRSAIAAARTARRARIWARAGAPPYSFPHAPRRTTTHDSGRCPPDPAHLIFFCAAAPGAAAAEHARPVPARAWFPEPYEVPLWHCSFNRF
ncbi:hypothetical protein CBM2587_B90178 [Cupriavidus taiwanensis]|uniref:Uncharacterized protein n=1 Tax=Cupriavidus taiwanensis TaxID=164546 RepID=A0A375CCY8_9BURK|nr:hypothetical protein CBM2587_B90178 [Cupriavidus taiwanensis]